MASIADQQTFAHRLVADLPGLDYGVAMAWVKAENGSYRGNLLGVTSSSARTTSNPHGLLSYSSPIEGADATANLLKSNYPGIINSLSGSPAQQAQAIIYSRWNTGQQYNPGTDTGGSTYYAGGALGQIAGSLISGFHSGGSQPATGGGGSGSTTASGKWTHLLTDLLVSNTKGWTTWQQALDNSPFFGTNNPDDKNSVLNALKALGISPSATMTTADAVKIESYLNSHGTGTSITGSGGGPNADNTGLSSLFPDIQSAILFIGVILVGLVLIGSGAIITLKRREA